MGADIDTPTGAAIAWLAESDEPGIRSMARRELLDEAPSPDNVFAGPIVSTLLSGQHPDGGFGVHAYSKWSGAHWRLVSLIELGVGTGDPHPLRAAETVLTWLTGKAHRSGIISIDGLTRRCASQEGNGLAMCSRLGMASDPRVALLAESLIEWQWPDGGWNCDRKATGRRSSFNESLPPCWGLHEYYLATGEIAARDAALRTAELFLEHRLFLSLAKGEVINKSWVALHYPPYWHYDILQALLVLSRLGVANDPRCADAIDLLERRRLPDGRWRPGGYWWKPAGTTGSNTDVVDWGRSIPSPMLTLNALRVLKSAKRIR